MSRKSQKPSCTELELNHLQKWSTSRTQELRLVGRAKIILLCLDGEPDNAIANELGTTPATVGKWRRRFIGFGLAGLYDSARSGKPVTYDPESTRNAVLKMLEQLPPKGQATWDGESVARAVGISPHKVWRILRKEGICLQRHRTWCVSTDPEFASKAADAIGLYLNPPENAIVFSIDEKPSIQALERVTGYVRTSNGKIAQGMKSTYVRHGTLNLFAALEVATGAVRTQITNQKRRIEFIEFMGTDSR